MYGRRKKGVGNRGKLVVAGRAKTMVELGDGADLQPRINTSLLQQPPSRPPTFAPASTRSLESSRASWLLPFCLKGTLCIADPSHHRLRSHRRSITLSRSMFRLFL